MQKGSFMKDNIFDTLDIEQITHSIIMVAGVGGAGGNALNHMIETGINDVTFLACNTDRQALDHSDATLKIQLGEGLGAGNDPEKGRAAALESLDDIFSMLRHEGTRMLFITAGMAGGTGTGASPIIAKAAKELDILTVAIVTTPFSDEGNKRIRQAQEGLEELKQYTDSILVLNNDILVDLYGDLSIDDGFNKANEVLANAVKGIAEIITGHGKVNVDFADIKAVMTDSGRALMGTARAGGPDRAQKVSEEVLNSPLLNNIGITGAKNILLNIYDDEQNGHTLTMNEARYIRGYLQEKTGNTANIIWGNAHKPIGEDLEIAVFITGLSDKVEDIKPLTVTAPSVVTDPAADYRQSAAAKAEDKTPEPKEKTADKTSVQGRDNVIRWRGKDRYENIDNIIKTPAWERNKVKFLSVGDSTRQSGKVTLEDAPEPHMTKRKENSLFDDI